MFILSDTVSPNVGIPPKEITTILRKCFIFKVIDHNATIHHSKTSTPSQWITMVMKNVECQFTGGAVLLFILIIFYEYYIRAWEESSRKKIRLVRHRHLITVCFFMVI